MNFESRFHEFFSKNDYFDLTNFFFHEQNEAQDKPSSSGLKKSAAGLCISMGSFSDPLELPGLFKFILTYFII